MQFLECAFLVNHPPVSETLPIFYFYWNPSRVLNNFEAVNIMIEIISRPELGQDILGLQPRDKAAMLVVNTTELFLEEFT